MRPHITGKLAANSGTAALAAVALAAGMQFAAAGAQASVTTHQPALSNPYAPAYHHAYRQGAVPTRQRLAKIRKWAGSHARALLANNLRYGGGVDGIGVTT